MVEETPDDRVSSTRERDRVASALRYISRCYGEPAPEAIAAIVDWHLEAIAASRTDVWLPGMAHSPNPIVQEVLKRYYAHHVGTAVARLIEENAGLRKRLLEAVDCLRSFIADMADEADRARAQAMLDRLLIEPRIADAGVIPSFLKAKPPRASPG